MSLVGVVENKVQAAAAGAGAGGAVASFILWVLGAYAFKGGVPEPVQVFVVVGASAVTAWVAGWLARHTPRPDLNPSPAAAPDLSSVPLPEPVPVPVEPPPVDPAAPAAG